MSLLQNSNAISAGGYDINNSVRLRRSASGYLSRTPSSATNRKTFTWSGWVKRGELGTIAGIAEDIFGIRIDGNNQFRFYFQDSDVIDIYNQVSGTIGARLITTQVFRDPSAWYHIVLAIDTTNATAGNRMRLYINGVEVTQFSTDTQPSLNYDTYVNTANAHYMGYFSAASFDGYLTEVNFIDGQALTPSSFGETDAVTGSWVAKKYTGTYGTNGFYLPFRSYTDTAYAGQFNGSTQYLTVAGNTAFDLTGDFTIESWINPSSLPNPTGIWSLQPASGGAGIRCTYEGQLLVALISGVGTLHAQLSGPVLTANNWYHVAVTRSGSALKLFVNGCVVATQTTSNWTGTSSPCMIGAARNYGSGAMFYYTGYQSNFRIVKGTALYTSNFVPPTSQLTNISGTSILTLQNSSAIDNSSNAFTITNNGTTTFPGGNVIFNANVLADASLTGSSWTPNNINYSFYGTTYDAMTDSPTLTSATVGNYCVLNPLSNLDGHTLSAGNLNLYQSSNQCSVFGTLGVSSGKWYWEVICYNGIMTGVADTQRSGGTYPGNFANSCAWNTYYTLDSANTYVSGTFTKAGSLSGSAATNGDVVGCALDMDAGTIVYYVNGSVRNSGNAVFTNITGTVFPVFRGPISATSSVNFGQRPFSYTPPTGYKALNTYNLPDSTIKKGNSYMDAVIYTGNGVSGRAVNTTTNFRPDFAWAKSRDVAGSSNILIDSNRGNNKYLISESTAAEGTASDLTFTSTGVTWNDGVSLNGNGYSYVNWFWQAGQGTTSSNTSGSITSTVSVNTTAGFSIVTYTGTGSNATVGHGLGVAPKMVIVKIRNGANDWFVWHTSLTSGAYYLNLNATSAQQSNSVVWNNTIPTSSVFSLGTSSAINGSTNTYVAYCWAEIAGYSKFGSYTGNGSNDGPFIYLGFRPKYIMVKRYSSSAGNAWCVWDSARETYNVENAIITVNTANAENTGTLYADFLSNGFKLRSYANGSENANGESYIYACWAENPFKNANAR